MITQDAVGRLYKISKGHLWSIRVGNETKWSELVELDPDNNKRLELIHANDGVAIVEDLSSGESIRIFHHGQLIPLPAKPGWFLREVNIDNGDLQTIWTSQSSVMVARTDREFVIPGFPDTVFSRPLFWQPQEEELIQALETPISHSHLPDSVTLRFLDYNGRVKRTADFKLTPHLADPSGE